jgi:hypothetical protein
VERLRLRRNARRDLIGGIMILAAGIVLWMVYAPFQEASILIRGFMPLAGGIMLTYGAFNLYRAIRLPRIDQ